MVGDNTAAYAKTKSNVAEIRETCGQICDTTITGVKGKYVDAIWKNFDCKELFSSDSFDRCVVSNYIS
jgi:hypothetical protein